MRGSSLFYEDLEMKTKAVSRLQYCTSFPTLGNTYFLSAPFSTIFDGLGFSGVIYITVLKESRQKKRKAAQKAALD